MANDDIQSLVAKSASTDLQVLLQAKENAKRMVMDDPSQANLSALQRATKMLDDAQAQQEDKAASLPDVASVLAYLAESGRKIKQAKLYKDIKSGLLRRDKDLSFRRSNVDKYATTLPLASMPESVSRGIEDRQRRKDDAEIRIREAEARRKELAADVAEGKYVPREAVDQELAARAVALNSELKSLIEARALELIAAVGGNPNQAHHFMRTVETVVDDCFARYAQPIDIEVIHDTAEDESENA